MIEEIKERIKLIAPLPKTVININKILNDEDAEIKKLIDEIRKDPIASASILKEANSPLYGFKNVQTIDKAIAMFGKSVTGGIIINALLKNSLKINLSPYKISEIDFQNISQKRSLIMMKWYSRINFKLLSTLAITSLIGNIGQVVIADVIKSLDKVEEFQELLLNKDVSQAEREIVGSTTIEVSTLIFEHWNLDEKIIKSIELSNSFKDIEVTDTDSEDLKSLAIANYIIYKLVDIVDANSMLEISEEMEILIEDNNLKLKFFKNAIGFLL